MSASQGSDNADLLLSNEVIRTLASELQRLRDKVAELKSDREDMKAEIRQAQILSEGLWELADLSARFLNEEKAEVKNLERANSGLQRELDAARGTLRAVQASSDDLRENLTKVKQELDETSHQTMGERLEHGCVVDTLTKRISELTDNRKQVKLEADLDQDVSCTY
ncbi:hypothetical protein EVJ58_g5421 [Rhodofomes roseus]|uniref:Uncharacterized protein n=1 Tax=Rhodofomes roseus TaxID=34475 RepID=A0A4Y9YCE1_9APHY|nr:hypothetical protein EVJ58_g5421 [Rhodofomes roseus]